MVPLCTTDGVVGWPEIVRSGTCEEGDSSWRVRRSRGSSEQIGCVGFPESGELVLGRHGGSSGSVKSFIMPFME